jgi:purine-binding chemotaxis protein CheW
MAAEQFVVFRLGAEEYAFPIAQVKEIIRYDGATKLPNAPDHMNGIINLRGKVIPVVDLAKRFGLVMENNADKRALIVEAADREFGIVVDEVSEVLMLEDGAIEQTDTMSFAAEFLQGIGKLEGRLVLILNLEKVFSNKEMGLMGEIA